MAVAARSLTHAEYNIKTTSISLNRNRNITEASETDCNNQKTATETAAKLQTVPETVAETAD